MKRTWLGPLTLAVAIGCAGARERATTDERTGLFRVGGAVTDAFDKPVQHIVVRLWAKGDTASSLTRGERYRYADVDPDGAYSFDDVPTGDYDLALASDGVKLGGIPDITRVTDDVVRNFQLDGFLQLSGTIVLAYSDRVTLELQSESGRGALTGFRIGSVRCTSLGLEDQRFRFSGLLPGKYRLTATSDRHGTSCYDFDLHQTIDDARIDLDPGLTFQGRIENLVDSNATRVSLSLWGEDGSRASTEPENGSFRMTGLRPQRYQAWLTARGPKRRDVRARRSLELLLEEDVLDFHYQLENVPPAQLVVELPRTTPATEASIVIVNGVDKETLSVRISGDPSGTEYELWYHDGYFYGWKPVAELSIRPPGGLSTVRIEMPGYEPWERTLELRSGERHHAKLTPIPGRLLSAEIDKAVYYRVDGRRSGSEDRWELLIWRDDRVIATHTPTPGVEHAWLPVGEYDLRVTTRSFRETVLRVRIADLPAPLTLTPGLERGLEIRGRIEAPTGATVPARLHLWRRVEGGWKVQPAKKHLRGERLYFAGLAPGAYRATLDEGGEIIVGAWTLKADSLVDQVVTLGRSKEPDER